MDRIHSLRENVSEIKFFLLHHYAAKEDAIFDNKNSIILQHRMMGLEPTNTLESIIKKYIESECNGTRALKEADIIKHVRAVYKNDSNSPKVYLTSDSDTEAVKALQGLAIVG